MTVLFDKGTRTFVAGVTNQIFVEKARREDSGIHAVVDIESGAVEIFDRHLEQAISLTPPDKWVTASFRLRTCLVRRAN